MIFYKVLLAIGLDKPGIVNLVSSFITGRGCNIEDSKMSVMGGRFCPGPAFFRAVFVY